MKDYNKTGLNLLKIACLLFFSAFILALIGNDNLGIAMLAVLFGVPAIILSSFLGIAAIIDGILSIKKGNKKKSALVLGILFMVLPIIPYGSFIRYEYYEYKESKNPERKYRLQCREILDDCMKKEKNYPLCRQRGRECMFSFQKEGLLSPLSVDKKGLEKKMEKLIKKGDIQRWKLSENERTLILWTDKYDPKHGFLSTEFGLRRRGPRDHGDFGYVRLFRPYVHNSYEADTCVEFRNLDDEMVQKDCVWFDSP